MRRVLVVPVNLVGRSPVSVDRAQVARALYGPDESVASRYRAISYGKVEFVGSVRDVTEPVTVAEPADLCASGLGHLAAEAEDASRRQGARPEEYADVVFVLPADTPCAWAGLGNIGGNRVWVEATTAKALRHELGHDLGMNHGVSWRGFEADSSDFMGSGVASLNAPHVVEMGWLRGFPGKVVELTQAGDLTLETLEADPRQSTTPKVTIVRPAPGANVYYLSYRASSAASPLPGEFTRGLNIHIGNPSRRVGGLTYFVTNLTDGAEYHDGPMVLRQVSHVDGGSVTFRVSFTGTGDAVPAGPPPAPPGTVQSLASGKCLDVPGGQTADGTRAIQYDCHGGRNQQWDLEATGDGAYRIVSRMSGKCIGSAPAGGSAGSEIVQSRCGSSPEQTWTVRSVANGSVIQSAASRLCLDVPRGSTANGARPIAWVCNGGPNQTWRYGL
jgi:hypothetical protein